MPIAALGQKPGDLDPGFQTSVTGDETFLETILVQPDGKILICGGFLTGVKGSHHVSIARLNPDGSVDTGFTAQADAEMDAMALQPDGKILIGGFFTHVNGIARNTLARLNADGTLDPSFDAGLGAQSSSPGFLYPVKAIAVQANGKIVVGGDFTSINGVAHRSLARLNSDGGLDNSFNPAVNNTGSFQTVHAIIIQADGKIAFGGNFTDVNGVALNSLARVNADGSVDSTFKATGVLINNGSFIPVDALALQTDGKILVGGQFATANGVTRKSLARLNADGSLESGFNPNLASGFPPVVNAIAVQPDGRIVVGGAYFFEMPDGSNNSLARLNADGSLDNSFSPVINSNSSFVDSLALQSDGKIVIGGGPFQGVNGTLQPDLARIQANGQLDTSFKPQLQGVGSVDIVKIQPDGKIVIAGTISAVNNSAHTAIARINSDGGVDSGFNAAVDFGVPPGPFAGRYLGAMAVQSDGKIVYSSYGFLTNDPTFQQHFRCARLNPDGSADNGFQVTVDGTVRVILLQPDNKILISGDFVTVNGTPRNHLARINPNGSVDNGFQSPQMTASILALQSDGKVLIGGDFGTGGGPHFDLARLNPNGTLDASFSAKLSSSTFAASDATLVAVQLDGKIIVGGQFEMADGVARNNIARLNANGSLDASFDPAMTNYFIRTVSLQQNGKVLIGGDFTQAGGEPHNNIARLNPNGSIDSSFTVSLGSNYNAALDPVGFVHAFGLQPDGGIILGGRFYSVNGVEHISLARLLGDPVIPSRLLNISTRMRVLTDSKVLIAGFIITGTDPKTVIIRGIGPELGGVGGTLSDPTLELHQGSNTLITNDNWKINDQTGQSQEAAIRATTIPPLNDLEPAIVTTLTPGAYTAILAGKNRGTGVGVVEVYDLAQAANSKLANISTRGFVDTGDNVMIGGLIVGGGAGGGTARVIVLARGPSLTDSGIAGALADPTLELHNGNGTMIVQNDNWKTRSDGSSQQVEIEATTVPPTKDLESALTATLAPDNYTAIVRGNNNTTGVGLVEVYNLQ